MVQSTVKRTRHAVYATHVHLVFVTKYRRAVFTSEMLTDCEAHMRRVCESFGAELEEFNGEVDHVHLLVTQPPTVSVSSLVNSLKGVSSRMLQKDYSVEIKKNLWGGALWSKSYYAATAGGAPLSVLEQYIKDQDRPKA